MLAVFFDVLLTCCLCFIHIYLCSVHIVLSFSKKNFRFRNKCLDNGFFYDVVNVIFNFEVTLIEKVEHLPLGNRLPLELIKIALFL